MRFAGTRQIAHDVVRVKAEESSWDSWIAGCNEGGKFSNLMHAYVARDEEYAGNEKLFLPLPSALCQCSEVSEDSRVGHTCQSSVEFRRVRLQIELDWPSALPNNICNLL